MVTVTFTVSVSQENSIQLSSPAVSPAHSQDANVLLGDMTGIVFHVDHIQEEPPDSEMPQHDLVMEEPQHDPAMEEPQNAPAQDDTIACGPVQHDAGFLHLVTHPDGTPVLDEDGIMTWVSSPSEMKEILATSPNHED